MRDPFWKSATVLLGYKRQLGIALVGAVITAFCFGGGLGMVLPTLHLLLGQKRSLGQLIEENLASPDQLQVVQTVAAWAADHVPADPLHAFLMVMAAVTVFTVGGSIGRYTHELLTLTVVARATMAWRKKLFRRLIHAQLYHTLLKGNADHISRIVTDTAVMGRGFYAILGKAVGQIFNGIAALMLAVLLDPKLTLIALIGAPVIGVLLRKFGKRIRRASKRLLQERGRMIGALGESLGGIRVVKAHHAEGFERRRFSQINRMVYKEEMRMRQARALASPLVETLGLFGVMAVASIAAWYIFRQDVSPERFMTVLISLGASAATLKPLSNLNNQLQESRAAAGRVLEILTIPVEPSGQEPGSLMRPLARHERDLVFDGVTVTYPDADRPAVERVALQIQHGQTLAIVGANGSGKTTLLSLLPRLLEPTAGRVLIDGVDIATVSMRSLRRQIAVVTQQTVLFEATIAQNIAYGRLHTPEDKIIAAAQAAYAHEFITNLPQGYNTVLGEGGEGLSGGQKQRLCIARAILRDPAILILDEATSQIDADSESKINQALSRFRHGRTTLVIAHRLSTVLDADRIAVLDDGKLIDQGTHAQLLERCGAYQALAQSQLQPAGV